MRQDCLCIAMQQDLSRSRIGGHLVLTAAIPPGRRSVYIPAGHMEGWRMDSILALSGQLMGLWLAIVGIAIVFGVLYAIGSSLTRWKRHRNGADQAGRAG
jgi:hypothetical protein